MTTTPFELVVLDLAGTTVADDGLVEAAFARAWDRVLDTEDGRAAALAHVRATMGQSKIDVFRALVDERLAQEINVAFEDAFRALIAEGRCEEIPGAHETIEALRSRGLKIAFTTGFARATADAILDSLGWRGLADVVLTPADAGGRGRPAPDLALAAMRLTDVSNAAAMVCVGDTESDARSGRAANAGLVVGVLTGSRSEAELKDAGAHVVIESVADLPALLP